MHKLIHSIFIIIISISICCGVLPKKPGKPDNPLDPANPKYKKPVVTILTGPDTLDATSVDSVSFTWQGDLDSLEYRYKLNDDIWSTFIRDTFITLNKLDDEFYTFSLQARVDYRV